MAQHDRLVCPVRGREAPPAGSEQRRAQRMIAINSFEPLTLVLLAAVNPAVIAVAFLMGRRADQWQKLFVAAFAASLAGFILYWIGGQIGVFSIHAVGGEAA